MCTCSNNVERHVICPSDMSTLRQGGILEGHIESLQAKGSSRSVHSGLKLRHCIASPPLLASPCRLRWLPTSCWMPSHALPCTAVACLMHELQSAHKVCHVVLRIFCFTARHFYVEELQTTDVVQYSQSNRWPIDRDSVNVDSRSGRYA